MLDGQIPEITHYTPVSLLNPHFLLFLIIHNRNDQHIFPGCRKDIKTNPSVLEFSQKGLVWGIIYC